eukprot:3933612-Rhodomonas_salina.2
MRKPVAARAASLVILARTDALGLVVPGHHCACPDVQPLFAQGTLTSYLRAIRCPVLTYHMVLQDSKGALLPAQKYLF